MMVRSHPSSLILHPFGLCLFALALSISSLSAQIIFDFGDWTSYRDTRGARAIDAGSQEVFFATAGGILSYHLVKNKWYDPMTVGYGLTEAIDLGDPVLLYLDTETHLLWVANRTEILYFDLLKERWRRASQNLWPPNQRVVNIGAGGSNIYVETIPEFDYNRWVSGYLPLPNPNWINNVTRYVGTRNFGGFQIDVSETDSIDARWRGLRSKLPIENSQLGPSTIGRPPAGFPPVLTPEGWLWQFDGNLIDPALRPHPITDWFIDGYNRFWSTQWGAGVQQVNLFNVHGELFAQGPAGNDIRALLLTGEDVWMGGANTGEFMGFSRADRSLKSWSFVESRDNTRIRTTYLHDLASWNDCLWFATEDGLLSYDKGGRWQVFTVQDNLYHNRVMALDTVGNELWIGTEDGLNVMVSPGNLISRVPQGGMQSFGVTDIEHCGDSIYVGTPVGMFSAPRKTREFRFAALDPGLLADEVKDISVYENEYWLVTKLGLMRYNQTSNESKSWLSSVWMKNAEPSCVYAMKKFVWVGTKNNGFYRFNEKTGEWINYTTVDGLVSNQVQIIRHDGWIDSFLLESSK
jgi:hypothetical protein